MHKKFIHCVCFCYLINHIYRPLKFNKIYQLFFNRRFNTFVIIKRIVPTFFSNCFHRIIGKKADNTNSKIVSYLIFIIFSKSLQLNWCLLYCRVINSKNSLSAIIVHHQSNLNRNNCLMVKNKQN